MPEHGWKDEEELESRSERRMLQLEGMLKREGRARSAVRARGRRPRLPRA